MKKILCIVLLFSILHAQDKDTEVISVGQAMLQESQGASATDSSTVDSNLSPQQRFEESPKFNVHEYNYKQQVVVGGVVMFCVTLAMVANNNYNPKRGK